MTKGLKALTTREIDLGAEGRHRYVSLPELEKAGIGKVSRLPVSLRIVLESVLRHAGEGAVTDEHVRQLASWKPNGPREDEIPFTIGRVVLNCAAGIPLLGDLTAIRGAVARAGLPADKVGPKVPLDMALDHTLMVDFYGTKDAADKNMALDFERNSERYRFVKWAQHAYDGIRLFPPGSGILHQLNLEVLAPGFLRQDGYVLPDTLVGTDSHTCMIAGLGVVGWGVGGIEAETAVLGEPVFFLTPDVVGIHVTGALREGVTATDLVLHVTEMLRRAKVVGKFVEFFGDGVLQLTVPDRATISNMAPEYGATIGYFPVDEQSLAYLRMTGRSEARVKAVETFYRAIGCFGAAREGAVDYSDILDLDLTKVVPNLAGPKRPQDRVALPDLKQRFAKLLTAPTADGGYAKASTDLRPIGDTTPGPRDGDAVIAAITSCTNTSNPGVMLAAGLLAKKAVERGLKSQPWVKTSLTPGSLVVSKYLEAAGLQSYLDQLGFVVAGYSCGTCVGASGPIDATLEAAINEKDIVAAAVLSGNRNFEARIHPAVRAAFLASPPLVVAFALAGNVNIDMDHEPLGTDNSGKPVYLRDIWPSQAEIDEAFKLAGNPEFYHAVYDEDGEAGKNPLWGGIADSTGTIYPFESSSTYLKEPPFLASELRHSVLTEVRRARPLAILGDSVTTDHISPIGSIRRSSPAGRYLEALGVKQADFNNYGARRLNHEIMIRGTFSNVRLKNRMVPGVEGGVTRHQPGGEEMTIYDAAMRYAEEKTPLVIVAGKEYGTGSARDWAAKGTRMLGVAAVVAESFERIHRSNLVGMGVLPLQFEGGTTAETLGLNGTESFDVLGLDGNAHPREMLTLRIHRADGSHLDVPVMLRIDTPAEIDYVRRGGIMPYMLEKLTEGAEAA